MLFHKGGIINPARSPYGAACNARGELHVSTESTHKTFFQARDLPATEELVGEKSSTGAGTGGPSTDDAGDSAVIQE